MSAGGLVDRVPPLGELLDPGELRPCLQPLLGDDLDAIVVFAEDGTRIFEVGTPRSPAAGWELLPPEAVLALGRADERGREFGVAERRAVVWPLVVGGERVGAVVAVADPSCARCVGAVPAFLTRLLQSSYAAWVTSELHLQSSATAWRAMAQQNAELVRAVEHLKQLDQLKSNFLATVSHELRTPLTSVIGFSEMLVEGIAGPLNSEQGEYVRTILARGEELLSLITHVLEMSQLEARAVRLDLRPVEVHLAAQRAVESLRLAAEQAGVTIQVVPSAVGAVLADSEKLQRILVNLVGNAIKFSPRGQAVEISAQAAPIRRPFEEVTLFGEELNDAVRISIRDHGIGIAADQLGRVFEAFYQVDSGPTRRHGGTGLGLSIVKNLVVAHGGEVWAESELGQGTTMHFTLPLASEHAISQ